MKKILAITLAVVTVLSLICCLSGCAYTPSGTPSGTAQDVINTVEAANTIQGNQPTPTDLNYSLERYNLIRRAYWVNGQRERANTLVCEIEKPLGYIVLFSGNAVVGNFVVDGKVSSLNSYLTPDSEYYEMNGGAKSDGNGRITYKNEWLADVDGTYGENDNGIFFFTPDGKYIEWSGDYLYSDIPFIVDNPVVSYEVVTP